MAQGGLLQTEYVVWDNIGLEKQNQDLEAYQLSSFVLQQIRVQNGLINSFHQSFQDNPQYQEYLEMLEYDMLYGEQAVLARPAATVRRICGWEPLPLCWSAAAFWGMLCMSSATGSPLLAASASIKSR